MRAFALLCALLAAGPVQAELQARDFNLDGVVDAYYDAATDLTWLADANLPKTLGFVYGGQMTWLEAMDWAANLDHFGVTGWRLPRALAFECFTDPYDLCKPIDSEFSRITDFSLFSNVSNGFWTGTLYDTALYARIAVWQLGRGLSGTDESESYAHAWAVRDGDVPEGFAAKRDYYALTSPVPEPSVGWLLTVGLLVLLCRRSSHCTATPV